MKISLNSLKISIAGAKLTHLVQRDRIWDHGSMIEQVRTVFVYLKKAFLRNDPSVAEKCLTVKAYKKAKADIELKKWNKIADTDLMSAEIISVTPSKHDQPDKFKVLIKLKKTLRLNLTEPAGFYKTDRLTEQEWVFMREGNWWLLDEIKK